MDDRTYNGSRLIITGASGYIGRRLVEMAIESGYQVVVLGTPPPTNFQSKAFPWRLGEHPPPEAFDGTVAVIHLAHSWTSDREAGFSPDNVNIGGSLKLATAALDAGVPRFIFASTTSARPLALNAYGRIKHALEQQLFALAEGRHKVTAARIGLVYGGRPGGQYALLVKLAGLPILPITGDRQLVQPIHIDEVCSGLITLAGKAPSQNNSDRYILAGPQAVTFGSFLRLLRRAQTGRSLVLLPIPLRAALAACRLTTILPFVPTIDRERILGIAALSPMDSAGDLAALKLTVIEPGTRLASLRPARRRKAAEAITLLSYLAGRRVSSTAAIVRLRKGIDRLGKQPLGLPRLVILCPPLLRILDPWRAGAGHRLSQRLHLAAMVLESLPRETTRRPSVLMVIRQIALDAFVLPFRLALGRWFA
jgi:nucleoside-diphosphate-sugar epimerase